MVQTSKTRAKAIRLSTKKTQEVAALIRGYKATDALVILEHTPRGAAKDLHKLLSSAIANATNNSGMSEATLVISQIDVSGGGMIKRMRPASRGRGLPYRRPLSNITIELSGSQSQKEGSGSTIKKSVKSRPKSKILAEAKIRSKKESAK